MGKMSEDERFTMVALIGAGICVVAWWVFYALTPMNIESPAYGILAIITGLVMGGLSAFFTWRRLTR